METELEAKFLDTNHETIRAKLKELGAQPKQPLRTMIRKNYDYPDRRLEKVGGWVRVRNEGDKTTLSYKQLDDRTLEGTKEVSVVVDDFDRTCEFLEVIGLKLDNYQETKRESWKLDNAEIELDEWPWIKPFIEMEATDEDELKSTASKLGLDWSKAVHGSVEIAYMTEYDVTESDVDHWPEIRFTPVPDWLEKRRKK